MQDNADFVTINTCYVNKTAQKFRYNRKSAFSEVYQQIIHYLKLPSDEKYKIFITDYAQYNQLFDDSMKLADFPINNDTTFIISPINYQFPQDPQNINNLQTNNTFLSNNPYSMNNNLNSVNNLLNTPINFPTNITPMDFDPYMFDINSNIVDYNTNFGFPILPDNNTSRFDINQAGNESILFNVYDGYESKDPIVIKLLPAFSFDETLTVLLSTMGTDRIGRYIMLLEYNNGKIQFFNEDQFIESYCCYDGMNLYLFHRDMQICVNMENHPPVLVSLDMMQNVGEIIKTVGNEFGNENYMCFSLFTCDDNGNDFPLKLNKTIIEQTKSLRRLKFQRNYFIFSLLDLTDIQTAYEAYEEANNKLVQQNLEISNRVAANIAKFSILIESKMQKTEISEIKSEDFSLKLPKSFTKQNEIIDQVRELVRAQKDEDVFILIKNAIKYIKNINGFATNNYECEITSTNSGDTQTFKANIEVTPLCMRVYSKQTGELLQRISFTKIIDLQNIGDYIDLTFYQNTKEMRYEINSENAEEIKTIIQESLHVLNQIVTVRYKYQAYLIANGIQGKNRVDLFTCRDTFLNETDQQKFSYDLDTSGYVLVQVAEINLGIPHNDDNVCLMHISDDIYIWMNLNKISAIYHLQNGMGICIMNRIQEIEITLIDGTKHKIKVDITKTIEDLCPDVFKQLDQPLLNGYTFFFNQYDLDVRKSIPEQVYTFNKLIFKRRYYVLSYEVLQDNYQLKMTVYDCDPLIKSGKLKMKENEFIDLLILSSKAKELSTKMKSLTSEDLMKITPDYLQNTENLLEKVKKANSSSKNIDSVNAAKKFLKIIRQLPGFGYEDYKTKYFQNIDDKSIVRKAIVSVGPLYVMIYNREDLENPLHKIYYGKIIEYQSMRMRMRIKFVKDDKGTVSVFEFVFSKKHRCSNLTAALYHNIFMTYNLLIAKRKKEADKLYEETRRLRGGFKDENGVIQDSMIDLFVTTDLTVLDNLPKEWFGLFWLGSFIIEILVMKFNLDPSIPYYLFLRGPNRSFNLFKNNTKLVENIPFRGSILAILPRFMNIIIHYYYGEEKITKTVFVDMTKTIHQLIPSIGDIFGVSYVVGFSLWATIKNELVPLDITRTINEQTPGICEFVFARRFSPENSVSVDEIDRIQLYQQTRDIFRRGAGWNSTKEEMGLLGYIQGFTDFNGDDSRIEKSYFQLVPTSVKLKNFSIIKDSTLKDTKTSLNKYIDMVRNIPGFSGGLFKVNIMNKQLGNVNFWFGPDDLKIMDSNMSNKLIVIPYNEIVKSTAIPSELSIYYVNDQRKLECLHGSCDFAQRASNLIQANKLVHRDVYDNKRMHAIQEGTILNTLKYIKQIPVTNLCSSMPYKTKTINLSLIKTVDELRTVLQNEFDIPKSLEIVFLVKNLYNSEIIGLYELIGYPYFQKESVLYVSPLYRKIYVFNEEYKQEVFHFSVYSEIKDIIPYIAWRFYQKFWNGFILYDADDILSSDLDVTKTLLEQRPQTTKYLFKRRYLIMTKNDAKSNEITDELYLFTKQSIINSNYKLSEKAALEFGTYSIIETLKENQKPSTWNGNIREHLPLNYSMHEDTPAKIKALLDIAPSMTKLAARKKYCSNARQLSQFGAKQFDCKYQNENSYVLVGPFGLEIIKKQQNNAENSKLSQKFSYSNIIFQCDLGQKLIFDVTNENGVQTHYELTSNEANSISYLMKQFMSSMYWNYYIRSNIQDMEEDDFIKVNANPEGPSSIELYLSEWVLDPKPKKFKFSLNWSLDTTVRISLYYLSLPLSVPYMIAYANKEGNLNLFMQGSYLMNLVPSEEGHLYLIPESDNYTVFLENGKAMENIISLYVPIVNQLQFIANDFMTIGNSLGYTLYDMSYEDPKPLEWLQIIPNVCRYWHELQFKRRYYLFLNENLLDLTTLETSFNECVNQIKNTELTPEIAGKLATYMHYVINGSKKPKFSLKYINEILENPKIPKFSDKEFERFYGKTKVDTIEDAMYYFVCEAASIRELAAEYYKVKVTTQDYNGEALIAMVCTGVIIYKNDNTNYELMFVPFYSLDNYYFEDKSKINLDFYSDNFSYITCIIETNEYFDQISSYIIDIFDLLGIIKSSGLTIASRPEFNNYSQMIDPSNFDDDFELTNFDFIPEYDINISVDDEYQKCEESFDNLEFLNFERENRFFNEAELLLSQNASIENLNVLTNLMEMAKNSNNLSNNDKENIKEIVKKCNSLISKKSKGKDVLIKKSDLSSINSALEKLIASNNKKISAIPKVNKSVENGEVDLKKLMYALAKSAGEVSVFSIVNQDKLKSLDINAKEFSAHMDSASKDIASLIPLLKTEEGKKQALQKLVQFNKLWNECHVYVTKASSNSDKKLQENSEVAEKFIDLLKSIQSILINDLQKGKVKYHIYPGESENLTIAIPAIKEVMQQIKDIKQNDPYSKAISNLSYSRLQKYLDDIIKLEPIIYQTPKNPDARFSIQSNLVKSRNVVQKLNYMKLIRGDILIQQIQSAINNFSALNITPDYIDTILDECKAILESIGNISNLHTTQFSEKVKSSVSEVSNLLKTIIDQLIKSKQPLIQCPSNGQIIKDVHYNLINLKIDLNKINDIAQKLKDLTYEGTCVLLASSLEKHVNTALGDIQFIDNPEDLKHYSGLMQVQLDTAKLINKLQETLDITPQTNGFPSKLKASYCRLVASRNLLNEKPFDPNLLNLQKDQLYKLKENVENIQKTTMNLQIPIDIVLKSIENALRLLSKAQLTPYIEPPTKETDEKLKNILEKIIDQSQKILVVPEMMRNRNLSNSVQSMIKHLYKVKPILSKSSELKDIDYLNKLIRLMKEITSYDSSLMSCSVYANDSDLKKYIAEFKDIISGLTKTQIPNKSILTDRIMTELEQLKVFAEKSKKQQISQVANDIILAIPNKDDILNINPFDLSHIVANFEVLNREIPNKLTDDLQKLLNLFNNCHLTMQKCYRLLPSTKRFNFDVKSYVRCGKSANIEENLLTLDNMIKAFDSLIKTIGQSEMVDKNDQTVKDLQKLISSFNNGSLVEFNNEQNIMNQLSNIIDCLPVIIGNSRNISSMIENDDFTMVSRIIGDNCVDILDRLNRPHMTSNNSRQFSQKFIPMVLNLASTTTNIAKSKKVTEDEFVLKEIEKLIDALNEILSTFDRLRPGEKQQSCDSLYSLLNQTIPNLQLNSDFSEYVSKLKSMHEFLTDYTSLPVVHIHSSDALLPRSPSPLENLDELFRLCMDVVSRENSRLEKVEMDKISLGLQNILLNKNKFPNYIFNAAEISTNFIKGFNQKHISNTARLISICDVDFNERISKLKEFIIKTSEKTCNLLPTISREFNDMLTKVKISPKKQQYIIELQSMLNEENLKSIVDSNSLSSVSLNYPTVQKIAKHLSLLMQDESNNSLYNTLNALIDFLCWNEQCHQGIYEFMNQLMTSIIQNFEDLSPKLESEEKIKQELIEIQKKWTEKLGNINRFRLLTIYQISECANDLLGVKYHLLPDLMKLIPNLEQISNLPKVCTEMEPIIPILRIFGKSLAGYQLNTLCNIMNSWIIANDIKLNPANSNYELSSIFTSLSYVKEVSPSVKNNKFTKQSELCFSTVTKIGSSTKQVDNNSMDELIKEITELLLISNEVVKIDFVSSKQLLLENDTKINLSALNNKSMISASELAQKIYKQTQNEDENQEEIPIDPDQKMENLVLPKNDIKVVDCSSINDAGVFAQLMLEDMSSDLYHLIFIQKIKTLMNLYKFNFPTIVDMISQSKLEFTREEVKDAFLKIKNYLSNVSYFEKSIKELKMSELMCHFSILSYISSNISPKSIKMDSYLIGSIQYQQKLLESAIINNSKSSKPLNAFSSPEIFRIINNLMSLHQFSIQISSILQILFSLKQNNTNVSAFDLIKHQNILQNELSLIKGGDLLVNYVKTLPNDEISTQINWILSILEYLASNYDDIINNENIILSNTKIIKFLANKVKYEKINDLSSISKLQSTLFKSLKKSELVLKLFFILQSQKVAHQIDNFDEDDSNEISLNLMITEIKSIFDQIRLCYSSNKLKKHIQSIEYERIKVQQVILRHLITYLIKTNNLSNDDQLLNHYINEFIGFSESLIYANPIILNNENIMRDFSISNIILENRIDIFLVKKSIEMMNDFSIFQLENNGQKTSKSKKQSKSDVLSEEETNKCLNILTNVHQNGITDQNKIFIKQNSKEINSILVEELEQMKNLSNSKEDFIALITSANILDKICILERLETTGIKANPPDKIEKSDNLDVLSLTHRMKYNVSILQLRLSKVFQQRCGINQQFASIPQIGSVLQKTKKVKINNLQNGIKIQMNLVDQVKELENQISKLESNQLILQQYLISDLISILGNKKSYKSNLTLKVEDTDAEMRNKILDSVIELQKKDIVRDPQCLLGMKCEEYNSINSKRLVFFDRSNKQMLAYRLRLLLNLCLQIYPKYEVIPKQNIFANLSDDEIIRIQECVKDMLFLSNNSASIKKFLEGVNEIDISRLVVLIQDLINRIDSGQIKNTSVGDIGLPTSINKSEVNSLMANVATKLMNELQNPSNEKSLNEEIEKLRYFSSQLMECDNTNCKQQLTSLVSIAPQVVAHLSALDPKSSLNPSKIIELCQLISNATTDKSKNREFKEGTLNLYELINSIYQTLQTFVEQDPYKSASKLYQSILEKDLPSMAKISSEIKTNEKFKELNEIIKPFYPTISNCFSIKTIQNDQFSNLSNNLLNYLNKSIISLFTILENLKSPLEVQPIISETRQKTEKSCSDFIYKIQMNEQKEAMNDLQDSAAFVSRCIASAIAGLQLTNTTQISSFFSISHCANNVSRMLSLQTGGIEILSSRPLLMKRAQRAYQRTIAKMFDLVEFSNEENITKLEKNKLNLVKSCFIPYRTLVTAISCRCEYRVPQTYYQVISGRFINFDKQINEIKKLCDILISSTGDLESVDKMREVFNSLCMQMIDSSNKLTNKEEIISITSTITQFSLTSTSLLNALVHVENFFETSTTGDFSSESLLPSIFAMPDVPKQSKSIEKDMKKYEESHSSTIKALQDINVSKSRNETLAKAISYLCSKQSTNIESALCVSYHLNNFSEVSEITSTCQDIVIQMNVLMKNIRMKFLNIECSQTNESIIHSIKKLVDTLFEKIKSSYQNYLSSEKLRMKQQSAFTKIISPLEASLSNLTKLRNEIYKLPNGQTKVYSTKLYEVSTNYLDGLVKVMKVSRDHPSKTIDPSTLNDFSTASCQAAQLSATAIEDIISKKGGSEDRVINAMSLFIQLNDQVRSINCADELKLIDVVSATAKLSQLVIDSAKAARDVKLAAKKKKDGKGSSLKSKTDYEEKGDVSEENISKRLILESRVLKAHYIHDFLQKKLSQIK